MEKFIYGVYSNSNSDVKIRKILGRSEKDAKERIIKQYWDKYDDLECDEWDDFLVELADLHGIFLSSELSDIEEI